MEKWIFDTSDLSSSNKPHDEKFVGSIRAIPILLILSSYRWVSPCQELNNKNLGSAKLPRPQIGLSIGLPQLKHGMAWIKIILHFLGTRVSRNLPDYKKPSD